jgi:hypothetical protein
MAGGPNSNTELKLGLNRIFRSLNIHMTAHLSTLDAVSKTPHEGQGCAEGAPESNDWRFKATPKSSRYKEHGIYSRRHQQLA